MEEQKSNNPVKIVGIVVLGIVMIFAILQQRFLPSDNEITVTGQGRVAVKPDMAELDLSVATLKAATPEDALNQTTQKMEKVKAALTEMGVSEDDQKMTAYAFNPQYDSSTDSDTDTSSNASAKIIGYNGFQQITIKVRGINDNKHLIDSLVERAVKEGANQVGNVKFISSDIEKIKQEAREKAIADAKSKADSMTKMAGVKIDKLKGWTENLITVPNQVYSEGTSSDNDSVSFPTENNLVSSYTNTQQEVVIELAVNFAVN